MSYTDDFNRADGALGANWTSPATSTVNANGTLLVNTNRVKAQTDDQHSFAIYSTGSFTDNQYSQITIPIVGAWNGACVRMQANTDRWYYGFLFAANDYRLYRWWDGTHYQLMQGTTTTWTAGDTLRVVCVGDANRVQLWLYRNTTLQLTWISPDTTLLKTGGNPGMGIYSPAGANLRNDNWQGGTAAAVYALDNFNRADGGLGSNWTNCIANQQNFRISTNKVIGGASSSQQSYAFWNATTFSDNQFSQVILSTIGGWSGVILRADASLNRFYLGLHDNSATPVLKIYVMWDGTLTQLATVNTGATPISNGDTMTMTVTGTTSPITIAISITNGTTLNSATLLSWTSPDNTFVRAGGSPGIAIYTSTGTPTIDNWQGGNLEPTLDPVVASGETRLYQLNGADPFRKSWIDQPTAIADQFYWV